MGKSSESGRVGGMKWNPPPSRRSLKTRMACAFVMGGHIGPPLQGCRLTESGNPGEGEFPGVINGMGHDA